MTLPLDNIYEQIAQSLINAIKGKWRYICLTIEITPDVSTTQGYYVEEISNEKRYFPVKYSTDKFFRKLHEQMSGTPQGDWKRAKFELYNTGKFDLSFEYDE